MNVSEILFLAVVLFSNVIQCITGFAGTVLAMPFSVMLVGYSTAKPILNILGILASVFIVLKNLKFINKKEFLKIIAVMLAGMAAGFYFQSLIGTDSKLLYVILGITVIVFAVINAFKFYTKREDKKYNTAVAGVLLVTSGIVHGMFVCGGPLLVTYLSGVIKDKDEFRSTVSAVWIVLNSVIMFSDIRAGFFTAEVVYLLIASAIALAAALVIGNLIYKKMDKNTFLQLTYFLMLISGVSLLLK